MAYTEWMRVKIKTTLGVGLVVKRLIYSRHVARVIQVM